MDIKAYFEKTNLNEVLNEKLTSREIQILSLYAVGDNVDEISKILYISKSTVNTHLDNICSKITCDSSDRKIICCLFWHIYQKELTKMSGYKKIKR